MKDSFLLSSSHVDARCCSVLLSLPLPARLSVRLSLPSPSPSDFPFSLFWSVREQQATLPYGQLVYLALCSAVILPVSVLMNSCLKSRTSQQAPQIQIPFLLKASVSRSTFLSLKKENKATVIQVFSLCSLVFRHSLRAIEQRNPSAGRWGE